MGDKHTSAVLAASFGWSNDAIADCEPSERREEVAQEALEWQQLSHEGAQAESIAYPFPMRRTTTWRGVTHVFEARQGMPPRQPNRVLELHGLMGAIGEQFGLAWTAEQDVQRLSQTRMSRDPIHQRLVARAQAELAGHFLLGSVHSLGNLVLRLLMLNREAALEIATTIKRGKGFPPGSDFRGAWPTLNKDLVDTLSRAVESTKNAGMKQAVAELSELQTGDAFASLDQRRGMDYHRRRPQSVPHTSPRAGTVHTENGLTRISGPAPSLDMEADAELLHGVVVDALVDVRDRMYGLRGAVPAAVRGEGISYPYDR